MKLHTKFDINYILGIITSKLTKWDVRVQPKNFPFLDNKTRLAFGGAHNGFYPEALGELFCQELEKHEMYVQANKGKNKQFIIEPFPPLIVGKFNLRLPKSKDLDMVDQDLILRCMIYYTSLGYCNTVETSDSNFAWIQVVLDDYKEICGIKE